MKALEKFDETLNEVEILLEETYEALADSQQASTSIERARHLSRANAFARSGIVLLSGHFEGFLKDILNEFAVELNNANIRPEFVPMALLETVLLALLRRCEAGSETHRQQLQSIITGKKSISIESSLISETGGNPKVDVIEKMLHKVGIPNIIESLSLEHFSVTTYQEKSQLDPAFKAGISNALSSTSTNLQNISDLETKIFKLIEKKWQSKITRRQVGYVAVIQNLLEKRNLIAHGQGNIKITDQELKSSLKEIKNLAVGINSALDSQLELICKSSTP